MQDTLGTSRSRLRDRSEPGLVTDWKNFDLTFSIDLRDRTIAAANSPAMTVLGLDEVPAPIDAVLAASTTAELVSLLPALRNRQVWRGTLELRPTAFGHREIESVVTVESDEPDNIAIVATEITQPAEYLAELAHRATHDYLTGLPNRALLMDRLTLANARFERTRRPLAVLLLDLDDFKAVNDNLGHATGDRTLVEAGAAMASALRPADTLARMGGDEFVALCTDLETAQDAVSIARRVLNQLGLVANPHTRGPMTASIGIAVTDPAFITDCDTLLELADLAMYESKQEKPGQVSLRLTGADSPVRRIEAGDPQALIDAIETNALSISADPVVDLRTGATVQLRIRPAFAGPDDVRHNASNLLEAMIDPELRLTVDQWMVDQARAVATDLGTSGGRTPRVTTSISGESIAGPGGSNLLNRLQANAADLGWRALGVEIDQSHLEPEVRSATHALDDAGVAVLIANFDPSLSGLGSVGDTSARTAMVDLRSVGNVHEPATQRVLAASCQSASTMGLTLAVSGVATSAELSQLQCLDVGAAEGPVFGSGLSPEATHKMLDSTWAIDFW